MYKIKYVNNTEEVKTFGNSNALAWFIAMAELPVIGYKKIK